MGTKWALLFGVTNLACAGLFVIAPFCGWWLPEGVSTHAWDVDLLFYIILGITGFFFLLTEAVMVVFMARYSRPLGTKLPPGEVPFWLKPLANVLNTEHKIEMAWTVLPAAILLYIAFAQINTWANIKYVSRQEGFIGKQTAVQMEVSARQFEWRVRYPSSKRFREWLTKDDKAILDAKSFGGITQSDDVHVVNEIHVWKDNPVVIHLGTRDVIHSFNLPHMRIKQDALPGKIIPVWFKPNLENVDPEGKQMVDAEGKAIRIWELACAELCGWGHGRMVGKTYVHKTEEEFLAWLEKAEASQRSYK